MRMPSIDDDILLKTLQIGVNTSARAKFEEQLYSQLSSQEDAEACFALALFNCVLIPFATSGPKEHKCFFESIEWSSRTIEINKEHWPALFLRSMIGLMMNSETDQMAMYLLPNDYTDKDAVDDLYRMIDLQKTLVEPSPYCTVPYVQLAYAKVINKDIEGAVAILKEAGDNIKFEEIPYFRNVCRLPFINLYKKAYELRNKEMLNILKCWVMALFPNQKFNAKDKK